MAPCVAFWATANPFSGPFILAVPPPGWSLVTRPCPTRLVSLPGSEEAINPAPCPPAAWPCPCVPSIVSKSPALPLWELQWREGSVCQVVSSCPGEWRVPRPILGPVLCVSSLSAASSSLCSLPLGSPTFSLASVLQPGLHAVPGMCQACSCPRPFAPAVCFLVWNVLP